MKIKFMLAGLAATVMLTGCGGDNSSDMADVVETSDDTSYSESTANIETEADTSAKADAAGESQETDVTGEVTNDTAVKTDEQEAGGGKFSDGVFHGSGYTLTVDEDVWVDMDFMIDMISQSAEGTLSDYGFDFTAEQYSQLYDGMFVCPGSSGANFNMTVVEMGMDMEISAELFGSILEQQYSAIEGCEMLACEDEAVGDYKSVKAEVKMTADDVTLKMRQNCFWENGKQVVITYTAQEEEFDGLLPDFEKVLESIEFE